MQQITQNICIYSTVNGIICVVFFFSAFALVWENEMCHIQLPSLELAADFSDKIT